MKKLALLLLFFPLFTFASGNLITSYSEVNYDYDYSEYNGSFLKFAPKLTMPADGDDTLGSVKFYLKKTGSPTGNVVVKVYSTGTTPNSLLATSDNLDIATLSTSYALTEFTFTGAEQINLVSGTVYFFSVEYSGGDGSNTLDIGAHNTTGDFAYYVASWNALSTKKFIHYIYDNDLGGSEDSTTTTATSTEATVQSIAFGLGIILVIIFIFISSYLWGTIVKKKPWK